MIICFLINKSGNHHEEIGFGKIDNISNKEEAIKQAKLNALNDGIQRAIRLFGKELPKNKRFIG